MDQRIRRKNGKGSKKMGRNMLLEAPTGKLFIKYAAQSILSMAGLSFYILADTFFVANGIGDDGLTALNLAIPVFTLINATGIMFGTGTATRFSILMGERRKESADRVFTQMFFIALATALFYTAGGLIFSEKIVLLLGAQGDITKLSLEYMRTILSFSVPFIMNQFFVAMVRNDHNPSLAMAAMLSGSFVNIILDYIFIFPFQMGMFGAAFASGFSPVITLMILSFHKIKGKNHFHFVRMKQFTTGIFRTISLGLPSFITEISTGIIILVFNFSLLSMRGNQGVAAYGIIANVALVCSAVFSGIGQGIQPIASMNYGAGRKERSRRVFFYGCATALLFGIIFYITGIFGRTEIIRIFNSQNDPVLKQIAERGIVIYFTAFLIMGINVIYAQYEAAVEKQKNSLAVSLCRGCIAVLIFIAVLPKFFGIDGVWMTIPAAEAVTFLFILVKEFVLKRGETKND